MFRWHVINEKALKVLYDLLLDFFSFYVKNFNKKVQIKCFQRNI